MAKDIVDAYMKEVYYKYGGSRKILSDNGTEFKNELFTTAVKKLGVEHKIYSGRFLLSVVHSYAPGCEPLVTGNLAMGLTIRSSHKQELSSVYQFIDVLYSLCIYEALRH